MEKEEKHIALALIRENNEIFLVKRKIEPLRGFWFFPGEVVEKAESAKQSILRETKEGTGLDIEIIKELKPSISFNEDKDRNEILHIFLCEPPSKKANINFEKYFDGRWFSFKEVSAPKFKFPSQFLRYLK